INKETPSYNSVQPCGEIETKTMNITGVTGIDIFNIGTLIIKQCLENQQDADTLTITTDKNIFPHLQTKQSGNALLLCLNDNVTIPSNVPVTFTALLRNISSLRAHNNTAIHLETPITNKDKIDFTAAYNAIIDGHSHIIKTKKLHANSTYNSSIQAQIEADDIHAKI